ncbi:inosine/xanthosine triphosphatase [Candidatus Woesebacteria bacterium CG_4_10_14_0_2_um_filter_39_14]|uniref:inosine/xanthosine triphosphatase n=2 Tax=Microgenomates group TaxID=1794810 RepID=A0A2M6YQ39_9BACT|nr:MAG: inosine/xanthosine triphosphatase [Candidatus Shapirobacteria bacterium CG07_land_8_20_14_0_80_39_12]PIZ49468.1 MAG: inosine/xanthosine triphosphatase [Candidatus Woesebacteria bacterium CG_4_10_14_0_2_um_filter_39_14]
MEKLIIALGTTYKQKIDFLKEVLNEIGVKAKIIPVKVESGVSSQPLISKETKQGSINRAKKALENIEDADCGIGIEIGYQKNNEGKYEMLCWTTIIDKKDIQISAKSHQFLLPVFHQDILKENKYLGDYVREYLKTSNDKIIQEIGIIIRDRKPFITNALHNALIRYLKKEEF